MITSAEIVRCLVDVMNSKFFNVLCELVRIDIFLFLVEHGCSCVGTIVEDFSQNWFVISRYLNFLEDAGLVASERDGRHIYYEVVGEVVVSQFEVLAREVRAMLSSNY